MYTKIEEQFWKDGKMIKLSFRARYLMMYLLTSPHRNILCFYFLPKPYACFDLGFSEEEYDESMNELVKSERLYYDEKSNVVFVKNYLKYNQLENQNQVKSAISKLSEIPENDLVKQFIEHLKSFNKPIYETLIKELVKRFGKGLDKPFTQPDNREQIADNSILSTTTTTTTGEGKPKQLKDVDDKEQDLAAVYQSYSDNIHPVSGKIEADKLHDLLQRFGKVWLITAIERAVERNKRSLGYIEGILKNWDTNGFDNGKDVPNGKSTRESTKFDSKSKSETGEQPNWDNFYK